MGRPPLHPTEKIKARIVYLNDDDWRDLSENARRSIEEPHASPGQAVSRYLRRAVEHMRGGDTGAAG